MSSFTRITTALLITTLLAAPSLAQVPSSIDPSQVQRRLGQEQRVPSGVSVEIPGLGTEDIGTVSDKKAFTLSSVRLAGSTAYTAEDFSSLYQDLVGKQVSFADLTQVAHQMTTKYRNDGYVLSRVILPPQKIRNGVVEFQAVEGFIDAVEITGDIRGDRKLLDRYADKITASRPIKASTLERYILLMDDLPGVTARSVIQPSATTPQAATLKVTLEHDAFEGDVSFDNRGNRFIGPYQLTGVAALNSALGMYERNTFRGVVTGELEELFFGEFNHEQQIGSEGTRMNLRAAATKVKPGGRLEPLDVEGDTQLLEMSFAHPFIRSREENLEFNGGLRVQNTQTDILSSELFEDKVRALTLGAQYDKADDWNGVNLYDASLTQGLDILGATDDGAGRSRINGENTFTRFNAGISRIQNFSQPWSLFLSAEGQYTSDSLLNSEQFALGGADFGRAFDGAEIAGDKGISGLAELRYDLYPQGLSWIDSSQLFGFYDIGSVWLNDPIFGEAEQASLASTGLGLRFNAISGISGSASVAFPLTRDVNSELDDDPRFFFSLLKRF